MYIMNYLKRIVSYKSNIPPSVKHALEKIGDQQIVSARCGRTPVQSLVQGALRTIATVPYDNLFHLFLELQLADRKWVIEKIERINLVPEDRSNKAGAEFTSSFPVGKTVYELFQNTEKHMGARFLPYQSNSNNCQVFIMGILDANGLNTPELTAFVKQDTRSIFKINSTLRKVANTLTDLGGYANAAMQGGELHHTFKNNELTDGELRQLLNRYEIPCNGIYIKNELPRLKNGNYIINLNGQSHWTALIKKGDKYYYFDSYGVVPLVDVQNVIGKKFRWSNRDIQDLNSSSCGWFCIAFLRFMNHKQDLDKTYELFIKMFMDNTIENEKILSGLLR